MEYIQKRRQEAGCSLLPVSVNLFRNSIYQKDIVGRYRELVSRYGIPLSSVSVEITESAYVSSDEVRPIADALIRAGFLLHMDDFGSGRSSLSSLNILHFTTAKIDKSLVDYIGDERGDIVLRHTMALMEDLGLKIVAEGVQTPQQKEFLVENGIDAIQGYLYAQPMPEEDYVRLLG